MVRTGLAGDLEEFLGRRLVWRLGRVGPPGDPARLRTGPEWALALSQEEDVAAPALEEVWL